MDVDGKLTRGNALTGSSCWRGGDPAAGSPDEPPDLALVVDANAVLLPPSGSECQGGSVPSQRNKALAALLSREEEGAAGLGAEVMRGQWLAG